MASGDTLLVFGPYHNEPPSSSAATLDTRNYHPCLDFDAAATEVAVFSGVMPQVYAGTTGITVYIHAALSSDTNNAHKVRWDAAFERIGDSQQDIDSDGFAAVQSVSMSVPSTSGYLDIVSIAFTDGAQMDSIAVGESFRLKVQRDHDHADDDATGDAELFKVEIRET